MGKVALCNAFIKGGIVDHNVYGFLDFLGKAMLLPAYYAEVIHGGLLVNGVLGEGALRCFLHLSLNVLADSPMCSSSQSAMSHLY